MTFLRLFLIIFFLPSLCLAGSLESLPKAKTTWGDVLNPNNVTPEKGFTAFYINTNEPKKVIASENVARVSINYAFKQFHDIESKDFGGYWVGKFFATKAGVYQINVGQSHAQTRAMLNRHIVLDNKESESIYLEKGEYLLEIEYINNWHTTDMQFDIRPTVKIVNTNMLKEKIDAMNLPKDTVVYAVNASTSSKENNIFIKLKSETRPYILILTSYRGTFWDVSKDAPKLVIYNNSVRGSDVKATDGTHLIAWSGGLNSYTDTSERNLDGCECDAIGHLHCSAGTDLKKLSDEIKQWTGFPLVGVNSAHNAKVVQVPGVVIDEVIMARNQKHRKKYEKAKSSCKKVNAQTIEGLMSE